MKEKEPPARTPLEEAIPRELLRSEIVAWAKRIDVESQDVLIAPVKQK